MKSKSAIEKRIGKLEEARKQRFRSLQSKTALDELEEMMSHDIFNNEETAARNAEWRRQWEEFCSEGISKEYITLKPVDKSMCFWKWQEKKGYITHEELVKLAGHENTIARWFRELPGIDPEEWPTPFPEYPEYNGDDVWNM